MITQQERFINRELSWLDFNQRVLDQACCHTNPLLERLKFVAITGSNLDEFFMVRIGGLKILNEIKPTSLSIDGRTPAEQLELISPQVAHLKRQQNQALREIESQLKPQGIQRLSIEELNNHQLEYIAERFEQEFQSLYSPLFVEEDGEFPLLLKSNLAILVRLAGENQLAPLSKSGESQEDLPPSKNHYVVLPLGTITDRFITVPSQDQYQFVLLEDVLVHLVDRFFPGQQVLESGVFRILRNADIQLDDDVTSDLLSGMQQILDARKTSDCVMLEHSHTMSVPMRQFLMNRLNIGRNAVYATDGPLDLSAYWELVGVQGYDRLRAEKWPAQASPDFPVDQSIFDVIAEKDRLLLHPYQSYDPVVRLLEEAAEDPDVIAIKQTLYRSSSDSRIVSALQRAAENDKHVTVIVELKARFDEARNIRWAQKLERSGADVIYGVKGLKTHAKCCIVVRRESAGIQRYVHVGTGNYNEATAEIYSDVSLFTREETIGRDAVSFFNAVSGFSVPQTLQKLVAAPIDLRPTLLQLIEFETERAQAQKTAMVSAKLNSLVDAEMIEALYRASQAGVKIRLNIRGICSLRAGVPGLSENIYVCSIVDRYLEHARIFHFHSGGEHRVFISSADWMSRNLNKRVELTTPIIDEQCKSKLLDALDMYFRDNVKSQALRSDGNYAPVGSDDREPFRCQFEFFRMFRQQREEIERGKATVFLPHRGESDTA